MRTQKQIEEETRILHEAHQYDPLVAGMLYNRFMRDRQIYDVFGNRCKCYMNDDGEWQSALCPEHWRE